MAFVAFDRSDHRDSYFWLGVRARHKAVQTTILDKNHGHMSSTACAMTCDMAPCDHSLDPFSPCFYGSSTCDWVFLVVIFQLLVGYCCERVGCILGLDVGERPYTLTGTDPVSCSVVGSWLGIFESRGSPTFSAPRHDRPPPPQACIKPAFLVCYSHSFVPPYILPCGPHSPPSLHWLLGY
jgi:hypothetical protein